MEKRHQRFVIKFFWLREYRPRQIYQELFATLGSDAYSEDSVQYWVARFETGDTSCEDISRAGRPLTDLAEPFRLFLHDYPFASARMLSRHFGVCATTVKDILARDLGLHKFTRRWVPHTLSGPQKVKRVEASIELFQILNDLQADSFDGIVTGDESWFQYLYESSAMFAESPADVTPRRKQQIGVKKTMFTLFFTNRKLLIAEDLPKGQKYNQDYFISDILPELEREKMRYKRRKQGGTFFVHMDHSKSHDGGKIQRKFEMKGLVRAPHPPYSPDLSPCDFWFFGMAKGKMKDREFHRVQDIRHCLTELWNDLTFEDVQSVFLEWKIRLNWVVENGGEYYSE